MSSIAGQLILHPKLSQALSLLATTNGRDKVFRLIQYLSRLIAWSLTRRGYADTADRFEGLKLGMTRARKALRLFRAADFLQSAAKLAQSPIRSLQTSGQVAHVTQIGRHVSYASFYFADMLAYLGSISVLKYDKIQIDKYQRMAFKFWLSGLILSLASSTASMVKLRADSRRFALSNEMARRDMSKAERTPEERARDEEERRSKGRAMLAQRQTLLSQLVMDSMDVWIPMTALGYTNFSDGTIGLLGLAVLGNQNPTTPWSTSASDDEAPARDGNEAASAIGEASERLIILKGSDDFTVSVHPEEFLPHHIIYNNDGSEVMIHPERYLSGQPLAVLQARSRNSTLNRTTGPGTPQEHSLPVSPTHNLASSSPAELLSSTFTTKTDEVEPMASVSSVPAELTAPQNTRRWQDLLTDINNYDPRLSHIMAHLYAQLHPEVKQSHIPRLINDFAVDLGVRLGRYTYSTKVSISNGRLSSADADLYRQGQKDILDSLAAGAMLSYCGGKFHSLSGEGSTNHTAGQRLREDLETVGGIR
ncbi:hypothetical protein M231_07351 [Tremella mesenterica]|uniref:Peroxisomal biogenesis factor 11 n=1 Tax=Tremella mesenterica TaxID=5217 RepID=A0A4Q1BBG1_TREME|nr:hypothetical protein M231_07351 [Tremella mesenterica]